MKVKALKTMGVNGQHVEKGQEVEVSDHEGKYLVDRGHAAKVEAKKAAPEKK